MVPKDPIPTLRRNREEEPEALGSRGWGRGPGSFAAGERGRVYELNLIHITVETASVSHCYKTQFPIPSSLKRQLHGLD